MRATNRAKTINSNMKNTWKSVKIISLCIDISFQMHLLVRKSISVSYAIYIDRSYCINSVAKFCVYCLCLQNKHTDIHIEKKKTQNLIEKNTFIHLKWTIFRIFNITWNEWNRQQHFQHVLSIKRFYLIPITGFKKYININMHKKHTYSHTYTYTYTLYI